MIKTSFNIHRRIAAAALALSFSTAMSTVSAHAHHPIGVTDTGTGGGVITQSANTLSAGQKAVSVTHEFIALSRLSEIALIESTMQERDVHSLGKIQTATVGLFYGLTDFITVGVAMPWVSRSEIFEGEEHDGEFEVEKLGTAEGLGDLTLTGQVRLYQNPQTGQAIAIIGGIELPAGSTGDKDLEGNSFEAEFQPGSGSVDLQLGGAFTQPVGPLTFDASTLYVFSNEGTQDVNLGDRFLYNAALSYRALGQGESHHHQINEVVPHSHRLAVDLIIELNGEWSDNERDSGVVDPDTGGNTLYLSPGLRVAGDGMAGFVSVGVPVSNNYNGTQSEPDWRIVSGFSLSLP